MWAKVVSAGKEERTGVTELIPEVTEKYGLLGCRAIALGGAGTHVPVRVWNPKEQSVQIFTNQFLPEFTGVVDDVVFSCANREIVGCQCHS